MLVPCAAPGAPRSADTEPRSTMNASSTAPTPSSAHEPAPADAPKKISLKRSPAQVRALIRERIDAGDRCLPNDLRALGVEGGNSELADLIGELREERKETGADGRARLNAGACDLPTLPPEFRRPDAMMRSAIASFVARVHGELQEQTELRLAACEQSARSRESSLAAALEAACEEATESARLLEEVHGQVARDAEDRRHLMARIDEHVAHHAVLQQSAADIRGALTAANAAVAVAIEEQNKLRFRAEYAENEFVGVKSELGSLRSLVDAQVEELRAQKVEVALRTGEARMLQRMIDGLVETNAALVARLVHPPVTPSSSVVRPRRPSPAKRTKALAPDR